MNRRLFTLVMLMAGTAAAQETVSVCFNYGCAEVASVRFGERRLREVRDLLDDALDAAHERALLAVAIGWLLGWAGEQSPIAADRGGNLADDGVNGRMDCIDHATTTTRLLRMLERRGWLRWHRVLDPAMRTRMLIFDHWSAVIEAAPRAPYRGAPGLRDEHAQMQTRYVVDSWFFDNGKPAVVMPLDDWMDGQGPVASDE